MRFEWIITNLKRIAALLVLMTIGLIAVSCGSVRSQYQARVTACDTKSGEERIQCYRAYRIDDEPTNCSVYVGGRHKWVDRHSFIHSQELVEEAHRRAGGENTTIGSFYPELREPVPMSVQCAVDDEAKQRRGAAESEAPKKVNIAERARAENAAAEKKTAESDAKEAAMVLGQVRQNVVAECGERWSQTSPRCDNEYATAAKTLAESHLALPQWVNQNAGHADLPTMVSQAIAQCQEYCALAAKLKMADSLTTCRAGYVKSGGKKATCAAPPDVGADNPLLQGCHSTCKIKGAEDLAESRAPSRDSPCTISCRIKGNDCASRCDDGGGVRMPDQECAMRCVRQRNACWAACK